MIDWDDAFDNSGHVPGSADLPDIWAREAAAFRASARPELDVAYGPGPRNRLDLFRPEGTSRGLVVFVHGGYWHKFDKSFWSHLARGPLAHGWAVAVPSYTLAPEARIARITREIGQAIAHAASLVEGPIRLTGHSAGGHLVARMVCDDSPLPPLVLSRLARVVPISGVHDLRPLLQTKMNDQLHLDETEARTESPALHARKGATPVTLWVGAAERPEFLRQTRLIAEAWAGAGIRDIYEPGKNHFSVVEGLTDPASPLVAELLE
ncbi:alpha/beta hydrolase [Jhaorihella thermophila]|uniref:Acetyl esterase/lipase n=1 Tax=Jhaorihella thermophila TaxID=488547 RepID=A0A1H5U638_9RHOB|nr:alpha/beta hydrolase [Jhaorihella thermophila]SEF70575.1 Acetyl esterase/lipase [Jhaorihella thermophila]